MQNAIYAIKMINRFSFCPKFSMANENYSPYFLSGMYHSRVLFYKISRVLNFF